MIEAWLKRGAERQALLRKLMQEVSNAEEAPSSEESMSEEERIGFELDLIQAIAVHLKQKVYPKDRRDEADGFASSLFFRDDILPRVGEFSKAEEENAWLLLNR